MYRIGTPFPRELGHHRAVPNGKPGDHPLSDLLSWGHPVFGSPIDDLLKEIDDIGGRSDLQTGEVATALWDLWPKWGRRSGDEPDYEALRVMLTELRDRLRHEGPAS